MALSAPAKTLTRTFDAPTQDAPPHAVPPRRVGTGAFAPGARISRRGSRRFDVCLSRRQCRREIRPAAAMRLRARRRSRPRTCAMFWVQQLRLVLDDPRPTPRTDAARREPQPSTPRAASLSMASGRTEQRAASRVKVQCTPSPTARARPRANPMRQPLVSSQVPTRRVFAVDFAAFYPGARTRGAAAGRRGRQLARRRHRMAARRGIAEPDRC